MVVNGTGYDEFDMYGDGVYDDEATILGGRKHAISAYNRFVRAYANKHGLSIPDAAHKIRVKGLWKGTAKKKRTTKRKTTRRKPIRRRLTTKKRRSGSKVRKTRTTRRKTTTRRRVRGRGLDEGGATLDELEEAMSILKKDRVNQNKQAKFNKKFDKLRCQRLKQLYLNAAPNADEDELNDYRTKYESCLTEKERRNVQEVDRMLSPREKQFLLKNYLQSVSFDDLKKNLI